MSSEQIDPKKAYGNFTELDPVSTEEELFRAFCSMKDNAKDSLLHEMEGKVRYFMYWKYVP